MAACGGRRARRVRCCPRSEPARLSRTRRTCRTCRIRRTRRTRRTRSAHRTRRRPAPSCPTYPTYGRSRRSLPNAVHIPKYIKFITLYIKSSIGLSSREVLTLLMYRKGTNTYYDKIFYKILLNILVRSWYIVKILNKLTGTLNVRF